MYGYGLGLPPMVSSAQRARANVVSVKKKQPRRKGEGSDGGSNQSLPEQPRVAHKDLLHMDPDELVDKGGGDRQRQHNQSLEVNWRLEDVARLAREVYDETIADVHLSLFAYWIRESDEHYQIGKQHIRELSLDQGYNIARIENVHLRKLLEDVHQIRPKEPLHAAAVKFQTLITTPRCGPAIKNRSTSSPVTAKTEALPPSFRAERERAMREAVRSSSLSSVSSPTRNYPPDTPDRPAPLSLRLSSSRGSSATPTTTNLTRSVSSPGRNLYPETLIPLPLPRNSVIFQDTASHPLLTVSARTSIQTTSETSTDDVFGLVSKGIGRQRDNVEDAKAMLELNDRNMSRRYASRERYDQHIPGLFELDALETSSNASHEADESHITNKNTKTGVSFTHKEDHIPRDETFDAMLPALDDELSILETASTTSGTDSQTRYSYTVPELPPHLNNADSIRTPSLHHTAVQVQRKISGSNPFTTSTNFHRPLPLRSYEGEAQLYSTSCAKGLANQDRVNSAHAEKMRCNRPTSLTIDLAPFAQAIPLPPRSSSITAQDKRLHLRPSSRATSGGHSQRRHETLPLPVENIGETESRTDLTEPRTAITSQHLSMASTLASFPIPPMENPVGELPMLISRATALTGSAVPSTSIAEAYRTITKAHITELLQQIRHQSTHLPILDWDDLPTFERAWREVNEQLLVSIYGRRDVLLTQEDVQYVDCISRQLRCGTYSSDWVRDIFQSAP